MIRVMGNSTERVRISDLGDVIYYHQQKDYTDQEFEQSKDLHRALKKGLIVKIDEQSYRSSSTSGEPSVRAPIDIREIKQAIREVQEETGPKSSGVKEAVREIMPLLLQMLRDEIKNIPVSSSTSAATETKTLREHRIDPQYIPEITTEGMRANITADTRNVSDSNVDSTLEALRKLKQQNST